jgi:hypothetical protein
MDHRSSLLHPSRPSQETADGLANVNGIDGDVNPRDALTSPFFVPMARYARYLLEEGVVSPERIREIFPARGLGDEPQP